MRGGGTFDQRLLPKSVCSSVRLLPSVPLPAALPLSSRRHVGPRRLDACILHGHLGPGAAGRHGGPGCPRCRRPGRGSQARVSRGRRHALHQVRRAQEPELPPQCFQFSAFYDRSEMHASFQTRAMRESNAVPGGLPWYCTMEQLPSQRHTFLYRSLQRPQTREQLSHLHHCKTRLFSSEPQVLAAPEGSLEACVGRQASRPLRQAACCTSCSVPWDVLPSPRRPAAAPLSAAAPPASSPPFTQADS